MHIPNLQSLRFPHPRKSLQNRSGAIPRTHTTPQYYRRKLNGMFQAGDRRRPPPHTRHRSLHRHLWSLTPHWFLLPARIVHRLDPLRGLILRQSDHLPAESTLLHTRVVSSPRDFLPLCHDPPQGKFPGRLEFLIYHLHYLLLGRSCQRPPFRVHSSIIIHIRGLALPV